MHFVGLIVLASGVKGFDVFILKFFPFLGSFEKLYLMIGGLIIIVIGIFFLRGSGRGRQHAKIKSPSRFAPPGKKVGHIGARRSGRK